MTHGRDKFGIMDAVTTSFGKQNRLTVSKSLAVFLLGLFVACLVGTGLLVYHLSSCTHSSKSVIQKVEVCNQTPVDEITTVGNTEEFFGTTTAVVTINADTTESPNFNKSIDVRLPTSIEPYSYEIKLIPFIVEGNFTFHGEVTILLNVTESTDNITLHADELVIDESSVSVYEVVTNDSSNSFNTTIPVREIGNDTEKQFLIIYLTTELEAGKRYYIHIKFIGILNDLLQGFYRSSYMANNQIRWIAATQFQPTDARKAFPCFDEPAMKAKFKISLARFKNMSTISNMRRMFSEPIDGLHDYEWDHYEDSIPMSTYLLAFVVSDFDFIRSGNFTVWARKEAIPQAKHSLEVGPKILKYFEDFFQIKFPLPKVDMIALPDFAAGAMENWGLITYRETAMLYEEGVSSRTNLQRITTVIAHELAHQWFGNLVTPKWWTDLWLNEGFASYMEYIGTNAVKPSWKIMDQFVVQEVQNVLALDGLKSSHQISIKVNNPNEINDIFDRISYAKGATIIRMMEHFLTSDVFRKGLTNYLNSRKYSSAEQDDLWLALTEQAHKDGVLRTDVSVKEIMDTWTLQTGFPIVTVVRSYEENFASFKQERFLLEHNKNETKPQVWWIPITYISKNDSATKSAWMSAESEIVLSDLGLATDDWLLVNVEQRGYYRVNYDHRNWQLLTQQLLDKKGYLKFSPTNRAQMLDDSLNLAAAGYLDYGIALNVTRYLVNERECVPWMSAFTALDYLQEMFIRSADFDKFKIYMMALMDGLYKDVGFEDSYNDSQLTVYNRMEMLWRSCLLGNLDCIRNAVTHFHNWRNSPNPDLYNPISPNLKNVVYCMAIRAGGQEEWDFAWERYLNTNVGSEKEIIMSALGCSRETWILSRYLHWAVTEGSGIRKQDSARVFTAVSNNIIGQELAYRFFKNNWDMLRKYMGSSLMLLNAIVKTCTSNFNTQEELDDIKNFVKANTEELSIVSRTLEQSIEQAEANVRWMNKNYHKIVRWLSSFKTVV